MTNTTKIKCDLADVQLEFVKELIASPESDAFSALSRIVCAAHEHLAPYNLREIEYHDPRYGKCERRENTRELTERLWQDALVAGWVNENGTTNKLHANEANKASIAQHATCHHAGLVWKVADTFSVCAPKSGNGQYQLWGGSDADAPEAHYLISNMQKLHAAWKDDPSMGYTTYKIAQMILSAYDNKFPGLTGGAVSNVGW